MVKDDETSNQKEEEEEEEEDSVGTIPIWSWLASAIGLILVVGSSGFLINQSLNARHLPPEFTVKARPPIKVANGYLVRIQIKNVGDEVAAALLVEGELKNGEKTIESSSATIDYLPSQSHRNAGLFFSKDPSSFELKIQPKSYVEP